MEIEQTHERHLLIAFSLTTQGHTERRRERRRDTHDQRVVSRGDGEKNIWDSTCMCIHRQTSFVMPKQHERYATTRSQTSLSHILIIIRMICLYSAQVLLISWHLVAAPASLSTNTKWRERDPVSRTAYKEKQLPYYERHLIIHFQEKCVISPLFSSFASSIELCLLIQIISCVCIRECVTHSRRQRKGWEWQVYRWCVSSDARGVQCNWMHETGWQGNSISVQKSGRTVCTQEEKRKWSRWFKNQISLSYWWYNGWK